MSSKRVDVDTANGRRSALLWDGAGAEAPWLHFAHATGMHGGLYARLLEPLADRFRILASDARGHGRSPGGPVGARVEWDDFAVDLLGVIDAVVPEHLGPAHRYPAETIAAVGRTLRTHLVSLMGLDRDALEADRYDRFRKLGAFRELEPHERHA